MKILYNNEWNNILDNTIIIGGSARSGTTIIGKLINSLKNVEYNFEPPMLISLLLKSNELSEDSLKELLQFYFYDNFLLDSLAGRNINLNINDDSCILHVKSKEEINNRYKTSIGRVGLENLVKNTYFSFKLPEIVFFMEIIKKLFPKNKTILMHRDPNDVINSLVKKKWFSNEFLNINHCSQIYCVKIINNIKVPYWIKSQDEEFWINATEIDRCGYYYKRISEEIYKNSSTSIIIDYDEFIKNPYIMFNNIVKYLKLDMTEKTSEILDTVKYQDKKREDYLKKLSKSIYVDVIDLDNKLKNMSLKI